MDITTIDQSQTPQDVYDAIMEASLHGKIEFDFLPHHDGSDGLGMLQNGMHTATLVTALTRVGMTHLPERLRPVKMLRWWVPKHGGGTKLVAVGGLP